MSPMESTHHGMTRLLGLPLAILLALWSLTLLVSLLWNLDLIADHTRSNALAVARTHFFRDQAFRFWGASHGGVYVPVDEDTPPSPYLTQLPERDVITPSGRLLTLMNPAYMLRQLTEQYSGLYGVKGHITSLKPLNPKNAPDDWEREALTILEQGKEEVVDFQMDENPPVLRLMRPMQVAEGCLKCHGNQGYKVGDVRGGVGITLPLTEALALEQTNRHGLMLSHGLSWLVGVGAISFLGWRERRRIRERERAEDEVLQLNRDLEQRVDTRTLDLSASNERLRIEILHREAAVVALEEQATHLQLALAAVHAGLWSWEENSPFVYWDGRMYDIHGLTYREFDGSLSIWLEQIIAPEDRAAIQTAFRDAFGEEELTTLRYRVLVAGEERHVMLRAAMVKDRLGKSRITGFCFDETSTRKMEEEREITRQTEQALFDLGRLSLEPISLAQQMDQALGIILSIPWLSTDSRGVLFLANDEQLHLIANRGLPDEQAARCRLLQKGECLCGKAAQERSILFACSNDPVHHAVVDHHLPHCHYCVPILLGGELLGLFNLYLFSWHVPRDKEEELLAAIANTLAGMIQGKRHQERLRLVGEAMKQAEEMMAIVGAGGVVLHANSSFAEKSGYAIADLMGQPLPWIRGEGKEEPQPPPWNTLLSNNRWKGRVKVARKEGGFQDLDLTLSPIRDESAQVTHTILVARDVTKELQLEIQLRQAQKMEAIGTLAAGIAHEINTPTQFIGDNVHFLGDAFRGLDRLLEMADSLVGETPSWAELRQEVDCDYLREEIPTAIEQTIHGVERVRIIVQAMKEFSHADRTGNRSLNDINKSIHNTLIIARNEIKYVADVHTELEEDLPAIPCNRNEINQVLLILVINAAHAIRERIARGELERGLIAISSTREGERLAIRVRDNGAGIPEAIRNRIFEPFFTTKEVGKGSGQGLSIAFDIIVNRHKGEIGFESELGVGTTFIVHLPADGSLAGETA